MNLKFLSTLSLLLAGLIVTADVIPIAAATADVEESAAVVGGGMRGGYAILKPTQASSNGSGDEYAPGSVGYQADGGGAGGLLRHEGNDDHDAADGSGLSGLTSTLGRLLRKLMVDIFHPAGVNPNPEDDKDDKDGAVDATDEEPMDSEVAASTSDLDQEQLAAIDLIANKEDMTSPWTSSNLDEDKLAATDVLAKTSVSKADTISKDTVDATSTRTLHVKQNERRAVETNPHFEQPHEAFNSQVSTIVNKAIAARTNSCPEQLPDLKDGAHCKDNFDSGAVCKHPTDIDPIDGPCYQLPDCPSWCNDPTYCCNTIVIDGTEVPKYKMSFFVPPVLVDASPNTKYSIAVREFLQGILPGYPKTRLWGYGDPDPKYWDGEDNPISFHNPAASIEAKQHKELNIAFLNDLVEDPEDCRCSRHPEDGSCEPLKHILQDCAGVPIVDTQLHWANPGGPKRDEAVCKDDSSRTDCTGKHSYVYNGPIPNVAHVHGAHADPHSDGYTTAWFLPKRPKDDYTNGEFYDKFADDNFYTPKIIDSCPAGKKSVGLETNTYRNDQSTATLFYHDHSLGLTRLNVMATSAGFYFIRDESCVIQGDSSGYQWFGESGLDCGSSDGNYKLPGPPPGPFALPLTTSTLASMKDKNIQPEVSKDWYNMEKTMLDVTRELPIAIQDMSFYWDQDKGETRQFYPGDHDNFLDEEGLVDKADRWGCNNLNGNKAYQEHKDKHGNIKPVPMIWNPEVFFDVAVVNGRAWPVHNVVRNRYRLRLLNACDSRFLSLSAWAVPPETAPTSFADLFAAGEELPIWVLGTEQSLLPGGPAKILSTTDSKANMPGSVTKFTCGNEEPSVATSPHEGLLMMPGERYDAMIDFSVTKEKYENGFEVYLINTGPNEPFKTFDLVDQDDNGNRVPFDTVGQLMKFNVAAREVRDDSTPPEKLCFDENPGGVAVFSSDDVKFHREVFLKEEVTVGPDLGPFAAVLDNVYADAEEGKGWAKPITENIKLHHVEEWDVINISGKVFFAGIL